MSGILAQISEEFASLTTRIKDLEEELAVFRKYNMYQYGKIYKITNTATKMVYVGCTSLPLEERYAIHRKKSLKGQMEIHKHMRKHGRDIFSIHLIKNFPTYSRWHLEKEEFKCQTVIPEHLRLFSHRSRIPFGLTYAEKNRTYSYNKYYRDKAKRTRLRLASLGPALASEVETDSGMSSE